jgi:hypothetical protein
MSSPFTKASHQEEVAALCATWKYTDSQLMLRETIHTVLWNPTVYVLVVHSSRLNQPRYK